MRTRERQVDGHYAKIAGVALALAFGGGSAATTSYADPPRAIVDRPAAAVEVDVAQSKPPIVTREYRMMIPFRVPAGANSSRRPTAVLLFLSTDGGQTWRKHDRRSVEEAGFPFQSVRDGEYQFISRLVDARGRMTPDSAPGPGATAELRIVVDTQPPQLELRVASSGGEIRVAYEASDPHLDPTSLSLSLREGDSGSWQPLDVDPPAETTATLQGTASYQPTTAAEQLTVRAEIRDRAGNVSNLLRSAGRGFVAADDVPAAELPYPETQPESGAIVWNDPLDAHAGATRLPPPEVADEALAASSPPPFPSRPGGFGRLASIPTAGPAPATVRESIGGLPEEAVAPSPPAPEPLDPTRLPKDAHPLVTADLTFDLQYALESIAADSVEQVELWATRDGGQRWESWGLDQDRESPMRIEADQPGVYGFSLVITARSGWTGRSPRSGDQPDVWVVIDQENPIVRIEGVTYGRGPDAGKLLIRWSALDDRLRPQPISLMYSENPAGPWRLIDERLENSGSYDWPVEANLAPELYLRIEARDEAGNVGVYHLGEPVRTDGLRPRAKIQNLLPATPE